MKLIFIINGCGGSGKDTFIEFVREFIPSAINFSSIDVIKRIARVIGWRGQKNERDRKFLSDLKQLCGEYNDLPFKSMEQERKEFLDSDSPVLFLHIREPQEIQRATNAFNAKTILVKNDNIESITSNMSDKNVNEYNYDIIIDNSGTLENLREKAKEFVERYCNGCYK